MADRTHRLSEFFYDRYVREATRLVAEHHAGMQPLAAREGPFCQAGCTACCGSVFYSSQAEIDVIAGYLTEHPATLQAFCARMTRRIRATQAHVQLLQRCAEPGEAGSAAAEEFLRLQIPCALLDEHTGLCTVYAVRPLVCAAYVSIVPARFCATEPKASLSRSMSEVHQRARQSLQKLLKKNRIEAKPKLDISAAVAVRLQELGVIGVDGEGRVAPLP